MSTHDFQQALSADDQGRDDEDTPRLTCPRCLTDLTGRLADRVLDDGSDVPDPLWPEWDCPVCGRVFSLHCQHEYEIHVVGNDRAGWTLEVWQAGSAESDAPIWEGERDYREDAWQSAQAWLLDHVMRDNHWGRPWRIVQKTTGGVSYIVFAKDMMNSQPAVHLSACRPGELVTRLFHPITDPQALVMLHAFLADANAVLPLIDYLLGVEG